MGDENHRPLQYFFTSVKNLTALWQRALRTDEDFFQEKAVYLKKHCNNTNLETDSLCSAEMKEKEKDSMFLQIGSKTYTVIKQ